MTTMTQPAADLAQRVDALRVHAKVLPGHRIELTVPELPEGATVEVIVVLPNVASAAPPALTQAGEEPRHVLDILASLPPGPRSAATWEEVERQFQEERNAWDKAR